MGSRSSGPCLLLLLATAPLAAQVPSRTLANPQEFAESFDRVTTFRELSNGKLLLVDMGPKTVQLVDFASGQITTIGRNGQGPGEYQFPADLIPYLGDTTLVVDRMSRRALPVALDGKMGKTISYPDGLGGMADPRAADAKGRLYFQASAFNFGGRVEVSPQMPESTAILRWDRGSNRIDTVARVKVQSTKVNISGGSNSRSVRIQQQPYAGQDEWAVTREGRVGVIRLGDYHLDWLGESPARGAPVKFEPVKIGAEEREAFMAQTRDTRNRVVMTSGGPGPGPENKPPEASEKDFEWPAVKPAFVPRSLLLSPEGEMWVQRSTAARDSVPVYDVFDAKGNLASRVTLPKGRRVVGLGKGTAYAVRTDDDGLQWLERYRR